MPYGVLIGNHNNVDCDVFSSILFGPKVLNDISKFCMQSSRTNMVNTWVGSGIDRENVCYT
jgi:hypothetical protein